MKFACKVGITTWNANISKLIKTENKQEEKKKKKKNKKKDSVAFEQINHSNIRFCYKMSCRKKLERNGAAHLMLVTLHSGLPKSAFYYNKTQNIETVHNQQLRQGCCVSTLFEIYITE